MENEEIKNNDTIQTDSTDITNTTDTKEATKVADVTDRIDNINETTSMESTEMTDKKLDEIFEDIFDGEAVVEEGKQKKLPKAVIDVTSLNPKAAQDAKEDSSQEWSSVKYKTMDAEEATPTVVEKKNNAEKLEKLKANTKAVSEKAGVVLSSMKTKTVDTAGKLQSVVKAKVENSEALDKLKENSKAAISKISTNMSEKKAEKQELKPEKVVLEPGEAKTYKLFFVSDMEEEAAYLHTLSTQGMHFVRKAGIQYVFKTGEAHNYYYHLGYYEKDKRDGDRYTFNYVEAGWEKIYSEKGEFNGMWNYFRTEVEDDAPAPEIFSDRVSRIALYERLLSSWRSLLAMIVICLLCMAIFLIVLNTKVGKISATVLIMCILVSIVFVLIFAIYGRIYLKINKKLANLKK